ncbi:MAG: SGNH/GDSL hydrolase family protein [Ginsengibacter sp.]
MQNKQPSKLSFIAKEKSRICIDSMYYYQFCAVDSAGKSISYSVDASPSWVLFNVAGHSLSGKPEKPGQYMIHISASTVDSTVHQRFMLTVYDSATSNILTLGNSITNGTNKYNSYRRALWQLLHKGNYDFDFIGSWSKHHMGSEFPDPDFDMDHDGHSGWKAADLLAQPEWDKQRGNIHDWIETYTPSIVLMELGTNEVFQCTPVKTALNDICSVIDIIRQKNPRVKIFVAQIPPLGAQWVNKKLCGNGISYGQAVKNFNKQLAVRVSAKNTITSRVTLVDQYSGIHASTDLYDDIHPNEVGEEKMAEKWYKAIHKYLRKL